MPPVVAGLAGCHDVRGRIFTTVLSRDQMFCGALKLASLSL
jgi:hypothetical protein